MKKHTALKQNIKKRFLILLEVWRQGVPHTRTGSSGAARGGGGTPPKLGSQENSWLRPRAKYTKLCMVWQPNVLNNCYELSGSYAPPEPPTRGSAPGPRWGTSVPQTACAPPTYKSWLCHWPAAEKLLSLKLLCVRGTTEQGQASHRHRASHQTVHILFLANDRCLRDYHLVVAHCWSLFS